MQGKGGVRGAGGAVGRNVTTRGGGASGASRPTPPQSSRGGLSASGRGGGGPPPPMGGGGGSGFAGGGGGGGTKAKALYDFMPENDDELEFSAGAIINVTSQSSGDWCVVFSLMCALLFFFF